jgi:Flp pilus assembly protein TadG
MAAALIPMIGMVGSAVDISRAYLVKTRLQQACDAGVLAARRTMTGQSVANDANAKTQATNFFNINLRNGAYGATVTSITVSDVNDSKGNSTGTVHGTASADVPTSLMKIFGKTKLTMTADCEAELQVSNNDVMFVLDVTGSMNCPAATPSCSNNNGVEASNSKIEAVREGVVSFYDTLAKATTSDSRLRIGIVPYSSNVNVGKLLPSTDLVDSWTYQSREAHKYAVSSSSAVTQSNTSFRSQSSCTSWGNSSPSDTDTSATTITRISYAYLDWNGTSRTCRRTATTSNLTLDDTNGTIYFWHYKPVTYTVSGFKAGNSVTTLTGSGFTNVSSTWNGCIEERQTVSNATFSSIPSNAYDLQIDLLPTDDTTKWKPYWPDVIFDRDTVASYQDASDHWQPSASNTYAECPKQAQKLAIMSHDDVYNYVHASDFVAIGGTYHDVGMLWGARLLSPTGIFSSENATAPNGEPINRHIVFMTDGDMAPNPQIYGLYGYEELDRRVSGASNTPTASDLKNRHNSRFSAICEAIKAKNITIWVIAYDQTMTTELQNCASPGKSFYASDDTSLNVALQTIAQQIAELRLSK